MKKALKFISAVIGWFLLWGATIALSEGLMSESERVMIAVALVMYLPLGILFRSLSLNMKSKRTRIVKSLENLCILLLLRGFILIASHLTLPSPYIKTITPLLLVGIPFLIVGAVFLFIIGRTKLDGEFQDEFNININRANSEANDTNKDQCIINDNELTSKETTTSEIKKYMDSVSIKDSSTIDDLHTNVEKLNDKTSRPRNKIKKSVRRLIILIVSIGIVLSSMLYYIFFYYPHNGTWETAINGKRIALILDKGDGELNVGYPLQGSNNRRYDVLIFNPKKKETTIGINGSSNKINLNKGVLIIELDNLYLPEFDYELNAVLYLEKK